MQSPREILTTQYWYSFIAALPFTCRPPLPAPPTQFGINADAGEVEFHLCNPRIQSLFLRWLRSQLVESFCVTGWVMNSLVHSLEVESYHHKHCYRKDVETFGDEPKIKTNIYRAHGIHLIRLTPREHCANNKTIQDL